MEPNNKKDGQKLWSLRQSAVYCRTDYESQKSTWLFVSLCEAAQKRINEYVQCCGEEPALHPFDIHFILVDIAVTQWRPYLVELTKDVEDHVRLLDAWWSGDILSGHRQRKSCSPHLTVKHQSISPLAGTDSS